MSLINKKVSEFKVQAYQNGDFKEVTLADVKGHWSVFVFYPADFTFVCPTELGDLADNYEKFQEIGCEIYSVSTDSHFVHKAWADASETIGKIKYPMLADPTGKLTRDFDVMIEANKKDIDMFKLIDDLKILFEKLQKNVKIYLRSFYFGPYSHYK